MPEYLSPGVYVEEISTGPKPIEGVGTSTAGFVGVTERGPESPQLVTSFLGFQRLYGGYVPDLSYLAYAVQGFFDNGGQRCFVTRVVSEAAAAATVKVGNLKLVAIGRGVWGNDVAVTVAEATQLPNGFRVELTYGDVFEAYDDLSLAAGASNNVVTVLNASSRLVRAWWDGDPALATENATLAGGADGDAIDAQDYFGDLDPIPIGPGGGAPAVAPEEEGKNKSRKAAKAAAAGPPPVLPPDEELGRSRGLQGLEVIDEIALLAVPDEVRSGLEPVTQAVITQCELLKDRFALVSALRGQSNINALRPPQDTSYAAFYYPWIEIFDAAANRSRLIPPTGHVAGIYARTDVERGVHKAPANAVVRGARNLELPVTKGMHDILNPRGVDVIRDFRSDGRGIRVWGARTMSSDGEWRYLNVRRLFIFIEESIDQGTQWVVFEPNDPTTWGRVRRSVTNFLTTVWRNGGLLGATQDEAFFVKCDRTTMTQDDIDNGRLICYIGVAPVKPAEFVIFRISQKTAEAA